MDLFDRVRQARGLANAGQGLPVSSVTKGIELLL